MRPRRLADLARPYPRCLQRRSADTTTEDRRGPAASRSTSGAGAECATTHRHLCRHVGMSHTCFDDGEPATAAQRAIEPAAAVGTRFAKCTGLMNALRRLSTVIVRWRQRRTAHRRLREMLRHEDMRRGARRLDVRRIRLMHPSAFAASNGNELSSRRPHERPWAFVLAGGNGTRLQTLTWIADHLLVMPVDDVYWSDWGTPEAVEQTLAILRPQEVNRHFAGTVNSHPRREPR